jgi:hypothetical protein
MWGDEDKEVIDSSIIASHVTKQFAVCKKGWEDEIFSAKTPSDEELPSPALSLCAVKGGSVSGSIDIDLDEKACWLCNHEHEKVDHPSTSFSSTL